MVADGEGNQDIAVQSFLVRRSAGHLGGLRGAQPHHWKSSGRVEADPLPRAGRTATGAGALIAAGRVRPATRSPGVLSSPVPSIRPSADVLDELRQER